MLKRLLTAGVVALALMTNVTAADETQKASATLEENFQAAPMILPVSIASLSASGLIMIERAVLMT